MSFGAGIPDFPKAQAYSVVGNWPSNSQRKILVSILASRTKTSTGKSMYPLGIMMAPALLRRSAEGPLRDFTGPQWTENLPSQSPMVPRCPVGKRNFHICDLMDNFLPSPQLEKH
jgi:hypothetical protein